MARPRSDIRDRALAAARAAFLDSGVDGTSLRAVARDAGTSIGMIHYYFESKDALFLEVVEEVYSALLAEMAEVLAGEEDPEVRLAALIERFGGLSQQELDVILLIVRESLMSTRRRDQLVERFLRGHVPLVLGALQAGVEQGSFSRDLPLPVLLLSTLALGIVPQLVRQQVGSRGPIALAPEGEELSKHLVQVLLGGISAPR